MLQHQAHVCAGHGTGHRQDHQPTERTLEKLPGNIESWLSASLRKSKIHEEIFYECMGFTKVEDSMLGFLR